MMIERTKELVELKYTVENGYKTNAQVNNKLIVCANGFRSWVSIDTLDGYSIDTSVWHSIYNSVDSRSVVD